MPHQPSVVTLHPSAGSASALLRALLERRRAGHSLEAPFYLSDEVFQADMEYIFRRHWIFAGVAPQVPEPGDYITVDVGPDSVLIVRDDDMDLRAFHNVCRHRGSRLCQEHQGTLGNIVCPYHQWTYDLEGRLIHADHMGEAFLREQHGLKKVHLRNLEGLLFICLADEAPADFEAMAQRMRPSRRTVSKTARWPRRSTSSRKATGSSRWRTTASATTA
jgi:Rieske 2Fe-2S family protein